MSALTPTRYQACTTHIDALRKQIDGMLIDDEHIAELLASLHNARHKPHHLSSVDLFEVSSEMVNDLEVWDDSDSAFGRSPFGDAMQAVNALSIWSKT
jgi:hypothetical protein